MKVTVNNTKANKSKPFPKLMSTKEGYIVFFIEPKKGICLQVAKDAADRIGDYDTDWNTSGFTDFNGSITLSND